MIHPTAPTGLVRDGAGFYTALCAQLSEDDILTAADEIIQRRFARTGQLMSVVETKQFLRQKLVLRDQEVFAIVLLDQRHRIIAFQELFYGTIDGATVHPRQVVKCALQHNAAAVVLSHNHPSGVAEPSEADRQVTVRLNAALALIDVRVIDHIVIGADSEVSFAERGYL